MSPYLLFGVATRGFSRRTCCVLLILDAATISARYVSFEGPLLHTEPTQPQTSVQQKTLNPSWDTTYRLQLGELRLLHLLLPRFSLLLLVIFM
jgi:hypothetical protein